MERRVDRQGMVGLHATALNHDKNSFEERQQRSNYLSQEREVKGLVLGIQGQAAGISSLNTQKNSVLQPPTLAVRAMGLGNKSFKAGPEATKVLSKIQKRDKSQDKLTSMNIG